MATNLLQQLRNSCTRGHGTSSWHLPGTAHEIWFIHIVILFVCLLYWWSHLQIDKIDHEKPTIPCNLECNTIQFFFSSCEFYIGTSLNFMGFFLWLKNLPNLALISNHFWLKCSFFCQKTEKLILLTKTVFLVILHACSFSLHCLRIRPMGLASCRNEVFLLFGFFLAGEGVGCGSGGVILENNIKSSHFHKGKVQRQHSNIRIT